MNEQDTKAVLIDALKDFTNHQLSDFALENLADSILRSWLAAGCALRGPAVNTLEDYEKEDISRDAFPALLGVK